MVNQAIPGEDSYSIISLSVIRLGNGHIVNKSIKALKEQYEFFQAKKDLCQTISKEENLEVC